MGERGLKFSTRQLALSALKWSNRAALPIYIAGVAQGIFEGDFTLVIAGVFMQLFNLWGLRIVYRYRKAWLP